MKMKKLALSLIALSCATTLFGQGSLTPPGAPAPTMKTLQQVEPRIDLATVAEGAGASFHHEILRSGSYYLSTNLEVTATTGGIVIDAPGVTLDLNGFEISGVSGTSYSGIYISTTGDGATVRNGSITGFSYGIYADGSAEGCLFEKLSVSACSDSGIRVWGESSRIIDCRVFNNLGDGISVGTGSTLNGCTAYGNQGQGHGIAVGTGSTLSDCTASYNEGAYGINAQQGSTLSGCAAFYNQGTGINAGDGSGLSGCTASGNHGTSGISAGSGSTLSGCTANNNESTALSSYGIYVYRSTVIGCSAYDNSNTSSLGTSSQGVGIYAGNGSTVKDCIASNNEGDGIWIPGDCTVSGNTCDGNGNNGDGAGIHSTSTDNRIDGNHVIDNDRGIDADSYGNFIVRNSASGNGTNYDITGTQTIGPIITATGTITTDNPWANFSF